MHVTELPYDIISHYVLGSSNKKSIKHMKKYEKILEAQLDSITKNIQLHQIENMESTSITKQPNKNINNDIISKLVQDQNAISREIIEVRKEIKRHDPLKIFVVELSILSIMTVLLLKSIHVF